MHLCGLLVALATLSPLSAAVRVREDLRLARVAFGSCNHQELDQPLWPLVLGVRPDLWIWMGDVIYGDYKALATYFPPIPTFQDAPPQMLIEKYALQAQNPGYAELTREVPVIGVWDDHDYGLNDGGKLYKYREQSQQLFLDFLGEPADTPRRRQEGVYTTYTIGEGEESVKFILLDVRYNKDPYSSQDGDFLGPIQWQWLEKELHASSAAFNVIISGIQILPQARFYGGERWDQFPGQRERLLNLILTANLKGVILLSGDVHFAEINQVQCGEFTSILTEITSSGMTHSWDSNNGWLSPLSLIFRAANIILPWSFRPHPSDYYGLKNFGEIHFDWTATPLPRATIQVRGEDGRVKLHTTVSSHFVEPGERDAGQSCQPIHPAAPIEVVIRWITMLGFLALLVGSSLALLLSLLWYLFLLFRRSYGLMMNLQANIFDRHGYDKLD